jgi:hypothetical protein
VSSCRGLAFLLVVLGAFRVDDQTHAGAGGVSARSCAMAPDVADRVRSLGGEDKLWALLDAATLGTRVIWGTGA